MSQDEDQIIKVAPGVNKPSEDFATYCEAEFERRLNSGTMFEENNYRQAMDMVMEKLVSMEEGE